MKITKISPQFNCIVCKHHDRYYTTESVVEWTFLKCNCGAEYTLGKVHYSNTHNKKELITFNSNTYYINNMYYKTNKYTVFLDKNNIRTRINNSYFGDIQDLFNKKSIDKIMSDIDKSIVFQK